MELPLPNKAFSQFLVKAKLATYASNSGEFIVDSILPHSHQLEFSENPLLYRDIYYGGIHFPGMEIVFFKGKPIWTMTYYGGLTRGTQSDEIGEMGDVLKAALREVPVSAPFRGPEIFQQKKFVYTNETRGDVLQFSGVEYIYRESKKIYHLEYNGGVVE
jgi:hypothetical protein